MMPPRSTETPLLPATNHANRRPPSLTTAANFLCRVSSRRLMRHLPVRVGESATDHVEQSQSGWAYSWLAIILDLTCNLAFIVASICVMIKSVNEDPGVPLRVWIIGYALQCGLHVVCACLECKRNYDRVEVLDGDSSEAVRDENSGSQSNEEDVVLNIDCDDHREAEETSGVAKLLDSAKTVFFFIWWIIGYYWICIGGQNLTHDSPQLYRSLQIEEASCLTSMHFFPWLCITFLVFDMFFVVICVAVACFAGLDICFCLQCILAILYAVEDDQEGGVKRFLEGSPRYKFQIISASQDGEIQDEEIQELPSGKMIECNTDTPIEHVLPLEDAVCCICLCAYKDGNLLRRLSCLHHFHSACIRRWLYLNATCPLCKNKI